MGLKKLILNFCLRIVDLLTFWIQPEPGTITFISLTHNRLSSDFALIDEQLKKDGRWKINYDLMVFHKNLWGDFLYFLNCLRQLPEIKRSQLVILNDNNYVISHMKPRHTKVLQVWHACGAVKQFGNQIRRQYSVGNYDAVLACSPVWKKPYSEAFAMSENQVKITGCPRLDTLLDESAMKKRSARLLKKYPQLRDRKILLYAPTFRGNIMDGMYSAPFSAQKLTDCLPEDWILVSKYHPLLRHSIEIDDRSLDLSGEDLYTLMWMSSAMVSDFSSVIFDYSLLMKPMIAYVPDLEEYAQTIGLNIPYLKDFPAPVTVTEEEIAEAVQVTSPEDITRRRKFRDKYFTHIDRNNTRRVVDLIDDMMKQPAQDAAA